MLRCSTLTLTIATCFACTPSLFGQAQLGTKFPSSLSQAVEKTRNTTSENLRIRQRPWLGNNSSKPNQKQNAPRVAKDSSTFLNGPMNLGKIASAASASKAKEKLSEIDPAVRKEIEDQVRREMEKKFESKIERLVQKQVRSQVSQVQQKLRRSVERSVQSNRVASLPSPSSVYRAPRRSGQPPTITGEILPVIVTEKAEESEEPKTENAPARYILTDYPAVDYRYHNNGSSTDPSPQLETPPHANQPLLPLLDGAETKPQADAESEQAEPTEVAKADPQPLLEQEPPAKPFSLRTSVIGPGALLKDQADGYEITISNITNEPATDIIVQLTVPEEVTISQLDRDAFLDQEKRTISWKVPSIEAGSKEVIKYRAVSSSAGEYKQEVTLGIENTFQGKTPFTTIVQVGAPKIPLEPSPAEANPLELDPAEPNSTKEYIEVAERLELEE